MSYFIDHGTDEREVATLAEAVTVLREHGVPEDQVRSVAATPVDAYIGHELELDNGGCVAIEGREEPVAEPATKFLVSPFIEGEMEESGIVSESGGGYDPLIGREYRAGRAGRGGRAYRLTARALRDFAEFLDAMAMANAQNENYSGARSCETHARRARQAARELEAAS